MKKSKYPRLRSKTYKGAAGQRWTYYLYDMRGTGKPDVRLGKDYDIAIAGWHKLHNHVPLTVGRIQSLKINCQGCTTATCANVPAIWQTTWQARPSCCSTAVNQLRAITTERNLKN